MCVYTYIYKTCLPTHIHSHINWHNVMEYNNFTLT